jgi:hypothetical protein
MKKKKTNYNSVSQSNIQIEIYCTSVILISFTSISPVLDPRQLKLWRSRHNSSIQ